MAGLSGVVQGSVELLFLSLLPCFLFYFHLASPVSKLRFSCGFLFNIFPPRSDEILLKVSNRFDFCLSVCLSLYSVPYLVFLNEVLRTTLPGLSPSSHLHHHHHHHDTVPQTHFPPAASWRLLVPSYLSLQSASLCFMGLSLCVALCTPSAELKTGKSRHSCRLYARLPSLIQQKDIKRNNRNNRKRTQTLGETTSWTFKNTNSTNSLIIKVVPPTIT